ncbi:MAG: LON peptidase substrate-binding domain-containing protein [Candidatus Poribacteria bacterium]|nr:LON peptidase substrate-binding domain-containing protein [Candidatus Poribacteria bacterium]MDE0506886.1 LON peptidase substrate-binding domain-containing protein [Candidatus Poribacteria bacterium]
MNIDSIEVPSEQELPLFPLNVVLFPGGILPLHIFEERYQLMIRLCLENESPFGVVLIKEGNETGEPAEPYHVGTAAQILEVDRLDGGRMNLMTSGQYRFEILEIQHNLPYLVGRVRVPNVPDLGGDKGLTPVASETRELYEDYEALLRQLFFDWEPPEVIPQDPRHLAYQIGVRLHISLEEKQELLETFPLNQLLAEEARLLKRENHRLRVQVIARNN